MDFELAKYEQTRRNQWEMILIAHNEREGYCKVKKTFRNNQITELQTNNDIFTYSRFCLIGAPVKRVSRLIGSNCEEQNPIKENALLYICIIRPLFCLIGPQL